MFHRDTDFIMWFLVLVKTLIISKDATWYDKRIICNVPGGYDAECIRVAAGVVFTMYGGELTAADDYEGAGIVAENDTTININNVDMHNFKNKVVSVPDFSSNVNITMDGCEVTNNMNYDVMCDFQSVSSNINIKNFLFKKIQVGELDGCGE